jgi:O-antigen ligase
MEFTTTVKQSLPTPNISHLYGLLITLFLVVTPWNRIWAEYIWIIIALTATIQIISHKVTSTPHQTLPKEIVRLNYIFVLIPIVSILSFIFSPLEDLPIKLLEPDLRWLLFIPIVIAIYRSRVNPNWVFIALSLYCISAFSECLVETNFLANLNTRARGDVNANPFGMYNAMITLMLASYLLDSSKEIAPALNKHIFTLILIAIISLGTLSVILTGTRTAIFTLLIGLILLSITSLKNKRGWAIAGIVFICLSLFISTPSGEKLSKRFLTIPEKAMLFFTYETDNQRKKAARNSTGQRLEQWRGSVCVFQKHPLLGTGPRSAREAFTKYSNKENCNLNLAVKPGPRQTHSMYFNTLLTLGIAGILVFSLFFMSLIKLTKSQFSSSNKTARLGAIMLSMYLISMAINGIALDMWFRNYMVNKNLIALLLPLIILAWHQKNPDMQKSSI